MAAALEPPVATDEFSFSVVQGGPLYRLRKKVGLIPEKGLGISFRILAMILLTWVPVIVGAIVEGVAFPGTSDDPLLRHFGIHTRLLIAVPLLILAEFPMDRNVRLVIAHFVTSGLVRPEQRPNLAAILRDCERFRDSHLGRIVVFGAVIAVLILSQSGAEIPHNHELTWVTTGSAPNAHTTVAGWWFMHVSRPIYVAIMAVWFWRLIVVWRLMSKISKLDLRLVPSHPDRAGGLGFLQLVVLACNPLLIANSVVLAGRWAHDVRFHDTQVESLQPLLALYVALVLVIFLGPFLTFSKTMLHFKYRSMLLYSTLIGEQGRLIDDKWISRRDVGENPLLTAPEIGPMADGITLYDTVSKLGFFPLGKEVVIRLVIATMIPIIPVFAMQMPLKQLILKLGAGLL